MRILQRGDTGNDVRTAQTALIRAGYAPGRADGIFGSNTERAVKQFQRVLGLRQDGIIGPRTWEFLQPFALESDPDVLRRGSRGNMVRILQQALEASGNSPGTIDSLFGTKTQAALRAFQRSARLPETGVANRDTWLAIAPFINYDNIYLRRGDRGMLVVILQTALYNAGFDPGAIDGIFGTRTHNALVAFQRAKGLSPDGIAGRRTWAQLKPYLSGGVMTYVIRPGDTLSSIARRFNTTVEELVRLNNIANPDLIIAGETLLIPA